MTVPQETLNWLLAGDAALRVLDWWGEDASQASVEGEIHG